MTTKLRHCIGRRRSHDRRCRTAGRRYAQAAGGLPAASEKRGPGRPPGRLGDHHHQIAQLLAKGERIGTIARQTGIIAHHISNLRRNPHFLQLIEKYRTDLAGIEIGALRGEQAIRAANLRLALDEQQWRLLEQPESISNRELQEMIADHSDRLDMGKTQRHLHGHVNLADNLSLARQRRLRLSASVDSQSDAEEAVPADHSGNGKLQ